MIQSLQTVIQSLRTLIQSLRSLNPHRWGFIKDFNARIPDARALG